MCSGLGREHLGELTVGEHLATERCERRVRAGEDLDGLPVHLADDFATVAGAAGSDGTGEHLFRDRDGVTRRPVDEQQLFFDSHGAHALSESSGGCAWAPGGRSTRQDDPWSAGSVAGGGWWGGVDC
ncbi:hypothetical protein DEJ36_10000 [Curtobacterium sp. MCPF17_052]|nr:hypothetical protein [Curtobacterium sp. MCPF17_052]WIB14058.1 hypothetical protein DEJ36_10000 [Curtobacterium sp. MCPF17_052]